MPCTGTCNRPPSPGSWLEANPEDVTRERLLEWRELGVRTLSLGVQSFDAAQLDFLGRQHSPVDALRALELALESDFWTVSVDLIYGLPGQSESAWRRDLEQALALEPDHLSCNQLTVHGGTEFGRRLKRGELVELPDAAPGRPLLPHPRAPRRPRLAGLRGVELRSRS